MNEYALEATYYRTALLLGLTAGADVLRWAEEIIEYDQAPLAPFFELVSVPASGLSELRHALFPLVIEPPPERVVKAVLQLVWLDLVEHRRGLQDTLTVVRQMRSMVKISAEIYASLNEALVNHDAETGERTALAMWLSQFASHSVAGLRRD